jgi:hypothetical protein
MTSTEATGCPKHIGSVMPASNAAPASNATPASNRVLSELAVTVSVRPQPNHAHITAAATNRRFM